MPLTPTARPKIGETIKLNEKVSPIPMPIMLMARVRTSSRVRSAISAVTTPLMAPAPCKARATAKVWTLSATAHMKLPKAKTTKPK